MLCHVDIQESSREDNGKFNLLGIAWNSKDPGEFIFWAIRKFKIRNLSSGGHHGADSEHGDIILSRSNN